MGKLYFSPFKLNLNSKLNVKLNAKNTQGYVEGLNLKYNTNNMDLYVSYICHPELGSLNLNETIRLLNQSIPDVIAQNFKVELNLKKSGQNYLKNFNRELISHYTLSHTLDKDFDFKCILDLKEKGFNRFKFKVNDSFFSYEQKFLCFIQEHVNLEFIFDFNLTGNFNSFKELNWPKPVLDRVFWEDPTTNINQSWQSLKELGFRIILDQKSFKSEMVDLNDFNIVTFKPTKECLADILKFFAGKSIMVTTNMGDELDHRISSYWASHLKINMPLLFFGAGLYTRHFFSQEYELDSNYIKKIADKKINQEYTDNIELEPNVFRALSLNFLNQNSLGWGLDSEFQNRQWTFLRDVSIEV